MLGGVVVFEVGEEQRSLKRSQFVLSSGPDCYTFVENGSKNRPGVIKFWGPLGNGDPGSYRDPFIGLGTPDAIAKERMCNL